LAPQKPGKNKGACPLFLLSLFLLSPNLGSGLLQKGITISHTFDIKRNTRLLDAMASSEICLKLREHNDTLQFTMFFLWIRIIDIYRMKSCISKGFLL